VRAQQTAEHARRHGFVGRQQLSSVNLVSARVGFDWKGKEFYVFGQNLLNQQYMTVNQPLGTSASTGNQIFGASYARGAVVGVGIQAKF
jgi:iron complex outermembrane recepter protein